MGGHVDPGSKDSVEAIECPEVEVRELNARFTRFDCPATERSPTVMDYTSISLPTSIHRFFDLKNGRGITVEQGFDGIVEEARIARSIGHRYGVYDRRNPRPRVLKRYPFHTRYPAWISAVIAYHWSTYIGEGRYLLSGFKPVVSLIDLRKETFHNYRLRTNCPNFHSARVHWDPASRRVYFWQNDSKGMFEASFVDRDYTSLCHIGWFDLDTGAVEIIWRGRMKGLVDDLRINETGEYLIACNFAPGYRDKVETCRNLIINLRTTEHWYTDEIATPAHGDFDIADPDVVYFSEHNFQLGDLGSLELTKSLVKRMLNRPLSTGLVSPFGKARLLKYRLMGNHSELVAATTYQKLFRLVAHWNFMYQGKHLLCAPSGNPASICLFHADDLSLYRTYGAPEPLATIIPSSDGERIYALAAKTKNIYILDTGTGDVVDRWNPNTYRFIHHMFHIGRVEGLEL